MVRTSNGTIYHGEDSARTAGELWRNGDVFIVRTTGIPWVRTDGAWVVGLPYGSCYGNEIGWTQVNAAQNTWYEVSDADMADGKLNAVTHDGNGKLTVAVAGCYLINYTCSAEVSAPNKHIQIGISLSGTESNAGISHYEAPTANAQFNAAGTAIVDLAANATVEVSLRTTDTGTPDLAVDHLNLTIVMVGGP